MKKDTVYKTIREIPAFDASDDNCRIAAGREVKSLDFERVVDTETGEIYRIPRLQASNPTWYFATGFNPRQPEITVIELAYQTVRCNEGLQIDLLYKLGCDDACPIQPAPSYNSFTAALSADKRIEMRDQEGVPVRGLKHNKRFCSYHIARDMNPRVKGLR